MIKYMLNVRTQLNREPIKELKQILLISKICGLLCCLAATIVLAFLPTSFLHCCLIANVIPGFVCGYIVVNFIGAITNYSQTDVIADICFGVVGLFTNLYISIDIFVEWVIWYSHESPSSYISEYGSEFLILSIICAINTITMIVQTIFGSCAVYQQTGIQETSPTDE